MAPRRGGGSSSGSSSSSSSNSCQEDWPCTSELSFIYGNRPASLWNNDELYGQLVLYIIWSLALLGQVLLIPAERKTDTPACRKGGAFLLRTGIALLLCSYIFICVRLGLISGGNNVPIGYRHEHSVAVLLERLAIPCIFAGVFHYTLHSTSASKPVTTTVKIAFYAAVVIYAGLNCAYLALDFGVSDSAISAFQGDYSTWILGDRDFALTMDESMVTELKTGATGSGFSSEYIMSRFDMDAEQVRIRGLQIKIGVAADVLALVLAMGVVVVGLVAWRRGVRKMLLLLLAACGLLLSTSFRAIVVLHYILHNWDVVNSTGAWVNFILSYPERDGVFTDIVPPEGFLNGYRITVKGFPIIQELLEPLGVVLASAVVVLMVWRERRQARGLVVVADHLHMNGGKGC